MTIQDAKTNLKISIRKTTNTITPAQIVTFSFFFVILLGAVLLFLPFSQSETAGGISFLDCLFTATSAVCVTGLVTVTTAIAWSPFGKLIIILLIQIGGLGLVAIITFFSVRFGRKITLKDRLTLQTAFNLNNFQGMVRMVLFVIKGVLICEGIGALILFFSFLKEGFGFTTSIAYGIFHSISAFCNAGFDIIGDASLIPYGSSVVLNVVIMSLIVFGGLGFSVWIDLAHNIKNHFSKRILRRWKFSLHTKLTLMATGFLLISGTIYFLLAEYHNVALWNHAGFGGKLLRSLFQSVTLRTAGFASINQGALSDTSKFISSLYMMIGGSPGGTAGGIKTVTIAIVLCSVWSVIKGRYTIDVFGKNIPLQFLQKSLTIIMIMMGLLCTGTALLAITEQNSVFLHNNVDLFYEVASALGTVGLTTGITPYLSPLGKLLIILCMFIGRIGPLSIMISLSKRSEKLGDNLRYPKEDILIG